MPDKDSAWTTVAGTGHRRKNLTVAGTDWLRRKLPLGMDHLRYHHGTTAIISGFANGYDLMFAAAAVETDMELHAYIPFEQQTDGWNVADRMEWERLRGLASVVRVIGTIPDVAGPARRAAVVGLLHARNDAMLARCDAVMAAIDMSKSSGGTHSAVLKAQRLGRPGVRLDPAAQQVRTIADARHWFH